MNKNFSVWHYYTSDWIREYMRIQGNMIIIVIRAERWILVVRWRHKSSWVVDVKSFCDILSLFMISKTRLALLFIVVACSFRLLCYDDCEWMAIKLTFLWEYKRVSLAFLIESAVVANKEAVSCWLDYFAKFDEWQTIFVLN